LSANGKESKTLLTMVFLFFCLLLLLVQRVVLGGILKFEFKFIRTFDYPAITNLLGFEKFGRDTLMPSEKPIVNQNNADLLSMQIRGSLLQDQMNLPENDEQIRAVTLRHDLFPKIFYSPSSQFIEISQCRAKL
jgi:hypothetical protein